MTPKLTLSVLDQSPIRKGGTPADAIRETLELAALADRLGYNRYWLAEHHSSGSLASASPEILIGQVAGATRNLRVGSGGVMLTHYAPLKVAEQFRMLETLFPGRIDLGVGRATGSDTRTARALASGALQPGLEHYPELLLELYGFLSDTIPPDHPFHGVRAMPTGPTMPELWLLGSSATGAAYAAELGWSFCFAHFITPEGGERIVQRYRETFEPSPFLDEPRAMLAVSVTCAETDEEAEYLSWSRWAGRIISGRDGGSGVLPPDEARAIPFTGPELDYIEYMRQNSVHGSPATVRARLEKLREAFDVDEIVVVTITYDFEARKRSYELLAKEFELATPGPPGPAAE